MQKNKLKKLLQEDISEASVILGVKQVKFNLHFFLHTKKNQGFKKEQETSLFKKIKMGTKTRRILRWFKIRRQNKKTQNKINLRQHFVWLFLLLLWPYAGHFIVAMSL